MRKTVSKHPVIWSVITVILFFISADIATLIIAYAPLFFLTNGSFVVQGAAESVVALFGVLLVLIFGYGFIWNETDHFGRGLACGAYTIIMPLISLLLTSAILLIDPTQLGFDELPPVEPGWRIAVFIVTMFLIGLAEEAFYRGIISNLFWDKHAHDIYGVRTAALYSGTIFGMMHILNIRATGLDGAGGVMVQVCGAIVMGIAFTAIYYRCRNIWVTIVIHAFLDFCGLFTAGLFGGSIAETVSTYTPLTAITTSLPYLIVVLVLLRKSKVMQILGEKGEPPRSPEELSASKRSFIRALIIVIAIWCFCFLMSAALSPEVQQSVSALFDSGGIDFGNEVLDVTNSGAWTGEMTFGSTCQFTVDTSAIYRIKITSRPEDPNAYVFIQIKLGDEVYYEDNFGGTCEVSLSTRLDAGEYDLNIVYNYSEATIPNSAYETRVYIR